MYRKALEPKPVTLRLGLRKEYSAPDKNPEGKNYGQQMIESWLYGDF